MALAAQGVTPLHPRVTLAALGTALASSATTFAAAIAPHCALGTHTNAVVAIAAIVSAVGAGVAALGRSIVSAPSENFLRNKRELDDAEQSSTPQAFPKQPGHAPVQFPIPNPAGTTGQKETHVMLKFLANIGQEFKVAEAVGAAVLSDIDAFAAGQVVSAPPITISSNANGKTVLVLSLQKVDKEQPFDLGSIPQLVGAVLIEELSGAPIAVPSFTERVGKTIVLISASFQRVPVAAAINAPQVQLPTGSLSAPASGLTESMPALTPPAIGTGSNSAATETVAAEKAAA